MKNLKAKINYDRLGVIFVLTGSIFAATIIVTNYFNLNFFPLYLMFLSIPVMFMGFVFAFIDSEQSTKQHIEVKRKLKLLIEQHREKEKELNKIYWRIRTLDCIIFQQVNDQRLNICLN